jgi:hypothetical protein
MEKKVWTKDEIKDKILTDDKWLERAVVAIYNKQTNDEKECEATIKDNGVGFSGAHARMGSYMARWVLKGNRLSDKWLDRARRMMVKYAGQLTRIANGGE